MHLSPQVLKFTGHYSTLTAGPCNGYQRSSLHYELWISTHLKLQNEHPSGCTWGDIRS